LSSGRTSKRKGIGAGKGIEHIYKKYKEIRRRLQKAKKKEHR